MENKRNFFMRILSSGDETSSKRFIGLLAFAIFTVAGFITIFLKRKIENEDLVTTFIDGLYWIVLAAFFGTVIELLINKGAVGGLFRKKATTEVNVDKVEKVEIDGEKPKE